MKRLLVLMGLSAVAMAFPWSVAMARGQWLPALALLGLWVAGYLCAVFLWFGVGVAAVALLGLAVTLTTWVPVRQ